MSTDAEEREERNERAFEHLVEEVWESLRGYFVSIAVNAPDVNPAVNEVMVSAPAFKELHECAARSWGYAAIPALCHDLAASMLLVVQHDEEHKDGTR